MMEEYYTNNIITTVRYYNYWNIIILFRICQTSWRDGKSRDCRSRLRPRWSVRRRRTVTTCTTVVGVQPFRRTVYVIIIIIILVVILAARRSHHLLASSGDRRRRWLTRASSGGGVGVRRVGAPFGGGRCCTMRKNAKYNIIIFLQV